MMSYLWILLLGSLLAASAKAQDDAEPTVEAAETTETTPEEVTTEYEEETTAEEDHEHTSEEVSPTEPEPETTEDPDPTAEEETTEATTEATTEIEETTPAAEDTAAEEEAAATTVAAETEEEPVATTPVPPVVPEPEPKAEEPESKEEDEEEPAKTNTTAPPPPPKSDADPEAEDSEEKPTDPVVPVPTIKPNVAAPEVHADVGFNLEDALAEGPVADPAQPGKSRSMGPGPQAAGATGDVDKPEAQESGSSSLAGILSVVVIAALGGVAAYITYQKKMLCFKNRQEADPEAARKADAAEAQSDPQVLSNLLNSS